jgi:hypothetical protein
MKTIERKSSKALFQNLWVKKQQGSPTTAGFACTVPYGRRPQIAGALGGGDRGQTRADGRDDGSGDADELAVACGPGVF